MALVAIYLFPTLWILWILSTWFRSVGTPVRTVIMRWVYIDLLLLAFFLGFWWQDHGWFQVEGANLAINILIAPVFLPLAELMRFYSQDFYEQTLGKIASLGESIQQQGVGDVLTHWIMTSLIIMPQSILLVLFSQWLIRLRLGSMPKTRRRNKD